MIEVIVYNYMTMAMDVPVYMQMPETLPDAFVLLEKTGGTKENQIKSATIACQSYAGSFYEAALLNEKVKEAMDSLVALDEVGASRLQSDYLFTDVVRKIPRYQAVYDITHY